MRGLWLVSYKQENDMSRPALIKFRQGYRMSTLLDGGLLLGSLIMAPWSTGATYYVAPNGADANLGTIDQPFRTVQAGLQVLGAGNTLRFIPIKPMVAKASAVRESYAVHSRPP
jgi:hypothetical protein